jgi:hypothetical protein
MMKNKLIAGHNANALSEVLSYRTKILKCNEVNYLSDRLPLGAMPVSKDNSFESLECEAITLANVSDKVSLLSKNEEFVWSSYLNTPDILGFKIFSLIEK